MTAVVEGRGGGETRLVHEPGRGGGVEGAAANCEVDCGVTQAELCAVTHRDVQEGARTNQVVAQGTGGPQHATGVHGEGEGVWGVS